MIRRRSLFSLAVCAILIAATAAITWVIRSRHAAQSESTEPVRVYVSSTRPVIGPTGEPGYEITVTIENTGCKTIRGYPLAYRGPRGDGQSIPYPNRQTIKPGESQQYVIHHWSDTNLTVTADFVNFADQSTWGPNRTKSEG